MIRFKVIKIGCDHLVCEKCKVAFDIKNGPAFWIDKFLENHWHKKDRRPSGVSYFQKSFREFPKHLKVRHRIPHGYISTRRPAYGCIGDHSFKKKDLLFEVRLSEAYWVWWRKLPLYLRSLWGAIKGENYKSFFKEDPFIVDKDDPEHDWMRSFDSDFGHQD